MANDEFRWHSQLPLDWKEVTKDPATCLWGTFAPCFLFGMNTTRITDGQTSFAKAATTHLFMGGFYCWCCCLPFYAAPFRETLRKKRNLPMDPFSDFHSHLFLHPCAVCQEKRELDSVEQTAMAAPSKPTIDRNTEETMKHLQRVQNRQMTPPTEVKSMDRIEETRKQSNDNSSHNQK